MKNSNAVIRAAINFTFMGWMLGSGGCATAPSDARTPPPLPRSPTGQLLSEREQAPGNDATGPDRRPAAILQKPPVYPAALRDKKISGQVLVDFVVDREGNVQAARVLQASDPEFAQAAIDCVSQWKFRPGQKGGQTVNTHMQVPVLFSFAPPVGNPGPVYVGSRLAPDDDSVPTFDISQVDEKPLPRLRAGPRYPFELRRAGVSGDAVVDFIVDEQGLVRNAHSVRDTHPLFGRAAAEAVAQWKFDPGIKNKRPVRTHMQAPIVFTLRDE